MTLQPIEPQQILDNTWKLHKELLLELDKSDDIDIDQVRFFLKTLAQAGAALGDTEDRSLLLELIRYWSSFIDRKTGEFPVVQLQPFDISLKRISSEEFVDPIKSSAEHSSNPEEAFPLSDHPQSSSSSIPLLQPPVTPSEHPQGSALLPAIWNVPYTRNPFFTGRDELLSLIHTQFQTNQIAALSQPQAINGLGGIGKTQLAIEYAYRYRQEYEAVLWIPAENRETLFYSYAALAVLLHLPEQETHDQDVIILSVKMWLQTHHHWLLIFDNADDLNLLQPFLPTSINGHILLTTRAWSMGRLATRLEVEPLSDEQGALLLLRRSGLLAPDHPLKQTTSQEHRWAMRLTQQLGGLPLALDQAGAYLEATGLSVAEYYRIYQRHRGELLRERRSLVPDHPESVATTWFLSFQRVEEKNPAAADLLRFCAYLAPDEIPEEIMIQGAEHLGSILESVVTDAFLFAGSIEVLRNYSLISRNPQTKTLSIHRLVQAVLRDSMPADLAQQWKQRAVLSVNMACPDIENIEQWEACERWLPHALVCAIWIEQEQMMEPDAADLLSQAGLYLDIRARYREAEPLLERALTIRERALGSEHPETAAGLNNLALLYQKQGKYGEAEPLLERALTIRERALGSEHPETAAGLNNLALLYQKQGKYGEAEPLYERALAIGEKMLKPEHPGTASSLNNLAFLYYNQGKYEEAEPLYERALAIREKVLGSEHPDTALSLNNLAALYYNLGKYEEAESLYKRALEIWEKVVGPEHPDTASSLNNLAELYQAQGKYEQAEPLIVRALNIYEQSLGFLHPNIALSLNNLARLYQRQSKYAEAEPLSQRALDIYEQLLGPSHPDTALSLYNLAFLYSAQDRFDEAEPLYLRALAILEQQLGQNHPSTQTVRANYISLQSRMHTEKSE
jgi:tetratricopeptide (TPR) repeat protein